MHYAEFKQGDLDLLRTLVRTFPFAVIAVNGPERPLIAQAPLTLRDAAAGSIAVDFHLARTNAIVAAMDDGVPVTIVVNGPSAHISPSWYKERFPSPAADRSRTAPTYDYISVVLTGRVRHLPADGLVEQIADLVRHHEPADGWKFEEIDSDLLRAWCGMLIGCRMEIESFDLTAKVSQDKGDGGRSGVVSGLTSRSELQDVAIARLIADYDGSPQSLSNAMGDLTRRRVRS